MIYDLKNNFNIENLRTRIEFLIKKQKVVELTEKKLQRSLQQNKYLHVILAYFGCQTGNTMEYVKQKYFKILVNPQTFIRDVDDKFLGKIKVLRSSADLDTCEMTVCIERFRNWSAGEAGIYLPSANEAEQIQQMEIEVDKNKMYL
jgi:hypothetical protein